MDILIAGNRKIFPNTDVTAKKSKSTGKLKIIS